MDIHVAKYTKIKDDKGTSKVLNENKDQSPANKTQENNSNQTQNIEKFNIDESNLKNSYALNKSPINNPHQATHNQNQETDYNKLIKDFIQSREFRAIVCPFDDSSESCQMCYKICAITTCIIILLVLYFTLKFS